MIARNDGSSQSQAGILPQTPYNRPMKSRNWFAVCCALFSFATYAAIPASEQAVAVEFYNASLDHYFISANPAEINDLDTGVHVGWTRTGYRFAVVKTGSAYPATVPVCRFFSQTLSSHFYSAKVSECNDVKVKFSNNWLFESDEVFRAFLVDPASGACPADTTPVYRLYNNRADANHRYTDQLAVFVFMKSKGYIPEGDGSPAFPVAFCTPSGGDIVPPPAANAPQCTLLPSSTAPAPGSTISITATCSNNASIFQWIGCTGTQSICTASQSSPGTASYTLYPANPQGPGVPVSMSVTWTTPNNPPPPPPGGNPPPSGNGPPLCGLDGNPRFPAIGTTLVLTATCSPAATSFQWLQCDPANPSNCSPIAACASGSATCNVTSSSAITARYIVTPSNSYGNGPWVQTDVEWQNSAAFGGFCSQYGRIKQFSIPWGDGTRYNTANYGGFTPETVFVIAVSVPSSPASYSSPGYTSLAEFNGPPTYRHMTLSNTPCDFRDPDPSGVNGPYGASAGPATLINWNVGALPIGLIAGRTYYFNVRNLGCGQDNCEASTSTSWPH